jgi:hypothetical protein
VVFNVRHPPNATVARSGKLVEGTVHEWSAVGIRSILKDHWQDRSGRWRDSIYFYELAPDEHENRVEFDEFFVAGSFRVARQETEASRAQAAWRDFTAR